MCILCEEPFRSIFIALAAVGAATLLYLAHKGVKRLFVGTPERVS